MPDRTEPEEPWIMPCIECGLQPDECRCPTPQWAKCGPTYDELLASHGRLLTALDNLLIYVPIGGTAFNTTSAANNARDAITAAKSLQGGK